MTPENAIIHEYTIETEKVSFSDPLVRFIYSSLHEVEEYLEESVESESSSACALSLYTTRAVLSEMDSHPFSFVITDQLRMLAAQLEFDKYSHEFRNRFLMYLYYAQSLEASYGDSEGRFCKLAAMMTHQELVVFSSLLCDFLYSCSSDESRKRMGFLRCFF